MIRYSSGQNKKGTGVITGWDGARTYRYAKVKNTNRWNYQEWNDEMKKFITEELGGKMQISTDEVIRDLAIPTTAKPKLKGWD